jgi:hypothetical protein
MALAVAGSGVHAMSSCVHCTTATFPVDGMEYALFVARAQRLTYLVLWTFFHIHLHARQATRGRFCTYVPATRRPGALHTWTGTHADHALPVVVVVVEARARRTTTAVGVGPSIATKQLLACADWSVSPCWLHVHAATTTPPKTPNPTFIFVSCHTPSGRPKFTTVIFSFVFSYIYFFCYASRYIIRLHTYIVKCVTT